MSEKPKGLIHIFILLSEVESRTKGSRPRTQKNLRPKTDFPRTDSLEAKDRNARGQGQGPRTQRTCVFQKNIAN